jgi:hypothetical protein
MLDSLDTLVAFVLIMLVVSLLITIAVQMVSAALNLRGLNLAQGLKRTFTVIDPESDQNAKDLANFILKGRFLSDSFLPDWGIFKPWRHATAIRPEEIFDAIQRIAIGKEPVDERLWKDIQSKPTKLKGLRTAWPTEPVAKETLGFRENARGLLVALGVPEETIDKAAQAIGATQRSTKELTNDVLKVLPEAAGTKVQRSLNTVTARLNTSAQAVATQIVSGTTAIDAAYQRFESWTCICQERAQQWFTMHTRILTIIFAIIAAFALQLDTVEIFKLVSSNRAVREKLVAQSAAIASQAEKTLGDSRTVLQSGYDAWLGSLDASVKAAVESASIKIEPTYTRKLTVDIEKALTNAKIEKNARDAALKSFDAAVNKSVTDFLNASGDQYAKVKADFDDTGFALFPKDSSFWRGSRWSNGWSWTHIMGVLFSVGLLSLGAPFWYNALKNLTSLRSIVAQNISSEQRQAPERADGSSSKPPPKTNAKL